MLAVNPLEGTTQLVPTHLMSNPLLPNPLLPNPLLPNPLLPSSNNLSQNQSSSSVLLPISAPPVISVQTQGTMNPLITSLSNLSSFQLPFTVTMKNSVSGVGMKLNQLATRQTKERAGEENDQPKNGKRLVLDLDETLVHSFAPKDNFLSFAEDLTDEQRKRVYALDFPGGETLFGYIRPGAENLIKTAFDEFESVAIWSAGTEFYVHEVVKLLFKDEPPLFVMTRNDCNELKINRNELACRYKPLEIIYKKYPGHNEANTLIVDDRIDISKLNCLNSIQIPEFNLTSNNSMSLLNDTSLEVLSSWFQTSEFRNTSDVRTLKAKSPFKI